MNKDITINCEQCEGEAMIEYDDKMCPHPDFCPFCGSKLGLDIDESGVLNNLNKEFIGFSDEE